MLRKTLTALVVVGAIALFASAQPASAANLVYNGSFEIDPASGPANGLDGWLIGGTWGGSSGIYPPVAIFYNSATAYPTGAFGEAVPPNTAPTNSPDPVGLRAAYFVDDFAVSQSLSQTVSLAAGIYQIGFSSYAPANGHANFYDAQFSGLVASVSLANYFVSAGPATTWKTFNGAANIVAPGNYLVEFVFNTGGAPAKDVVIDQVYIIEGNPEIPAIPEPGTLVLVGSALLGGLRRMKRRAAPRD